MPSLPSISLALNFANAIFPEIFGSALSPHKSNPPMADSPAASNLKSAILAVPAATSAMMAALTAAYWLPPGKVSPVTFVVSSKPSTEML